MSNIAIKVENLSKAYQLGEIGTGTISRDLERWYSRIRGKEDPFLRIGEANDRTSKGSSDIVWSLKDVNFEIEQGDAIGIIGRNGAGKSTLLKVLSKVTSPTSGRITGNGRIASLLEVGTGFHPELTGRENIYLNGAILGMRKKEITRKFDEIVDFAGVERYVDTPVKRYSSGMYVRLAFAVAAHLESEILIVDEVLAVGDAEFQKKCLGKMGEVSKGEGRTVLFVSHNMNAINNLCKKSILLSNGKIVKSGDTASVANFYIQQHKGNTAEKQWNKDYPGNEKVTLKSISILNDQNKIADKFFLDEAITIRTIFEILEDDMKLCHSIALTDINDTIVFISLSNSDDRYKYPLSKGVYYIDCEIPSNLLNEGNYAVISNIADHKHAVIAETNKEISFEMVDSGKYRAGYFGTWNGVTRPILNWKTEELKQI